MQVEVLNLSNTLELPEYATELSAGLDLRACFDVKGRCKVITEDNTNLSFDLNISSVITLPPRGRALIPTGIKLGLPVGFEAQVRPRSGLAIKNGITVLNTPGTIDADYRGEVGVILINHTDEDFTIKHGDRIAQLVITKYEKITWNPVQSLDVTERGEGGFGHSGK